MFAPSLDLKVHLVPIIFGCVKNCWHIPEFLHRYVTTVACKTCQGHANILLVQKINVLAVYHQCTVVNICLSTGSVAHSDRGLVIYLILYIYIYIYIYNKYKHAFPAQSAYIYCCCSL